MTTLILIRHGQSQSNLARIFTGHLDIPLTDFGHQQAQLTAEHITANYKVDRVYASDLCRAFATGKAVADRLGLDVIAHRNLREIWAGQWEGKAFDALGVEFPESYHTWRFDIGRCVCDGGESVAALQQRVVGTLETIARENDGKTIVVATHATPIRTLQCHCKGLPLSEMKNIPWVTNASITVVSFDGGSFRLIQEGYDAHLQDKVSRFPKNV